MTGQSPTTIMVADDEQSNLELIREFFDHEDYSLEFATDGEQVWEKLEAEPGRFDVLLLDRMMPGLDGIELLKRIKKTPELKDIPVILQTALVSHDNIVEGLNAGAFYYLTKPYSRKLLYSVVNIALEDLNRTRALKQELKKSSNTLNLLQEGTFKIRSLNEAKNLATLLANSFPEPEKVILGLSELLINSIEHGNLEIGYDEKSRLQRDGQWISEIENRLASADYNARYTEVHFNKNDQQVSVRITDQGKGFDWKKYIALDVTRIFDTHGRGIAMSKSICFDRVEYNDKGNEVTACVALNQVPA